MNRVCIAAETLVDEWLVYRHQRIIYSIVLSCTSIEEGPHNASCLAIRVHYPEQNGPL